MAEVTLTDFVKRLKFGIDLHRPADVMLVLSGFIRPPNTWVDLGFLEPLTEKRGGSIALTTFATAVANMSDQSEDWKQWFPGPLLKSIEVKTYVTWVSKHLYQLTPLGEKTFACYQEQINHG